MNFIKEERVKEILEKFPTIDPIMVIGDVGIDKYTYGEVKRISPEAPVPVLEVTKEWLKLGMAANITHNLQSLNVKSTLSGVVGDDQNANAFEDLLEDCELSTWGIVRCDQRPTIMKERVTTNQNQQICRIDYEKKDNLTQATRERLLKRGHDLLEGHGSLIIEDYAKGTLDRELIAELTSIFQKEGKLVGVDPGRGTDPKLYSGVNLLKPNWVEAMTMCQSLGHSSSEVGEVAKILSQELEIEKLVITLGSEGMALWDVADKDKNLVRIPTFARAVFDVSGAGDTAMSLLMATLSAGGSLEEAAWMANCGSGVVVGKNGTETVNGKELMNFYQNVKKLVESEELKLS